MNMLRTSYMGLELKNPLIAGASSLTSDLTKIKELEQSGVGAVVIKSLLEEEIQIKEEMFSRDISRYDELHAEMTTMFPDLVFRGAEEHISWIRKTKETISVPVIASLNCINRESWLQYAAEIESAGADALELNFYYLSKAAETTSREIEDDMAETAHLVCEKVNIPVSVKLSHYLTNPATFLEKLAGAGVKGVVLFNRLFQSEVDIDAEKEVPSFRFTDSSMLGESLRWTGLLSGNTSIDICGSTGVHDYRDIVKLIMAGAAAVQAVSVFYEKGAGEAEHMLSGLEKWLEGNGKSIEDIRGMLAKSRLSDPWAYERSQYIKMLMGKSRMFDM